MVLRETTQNTIMTEGDEPKNTNDNNIQLEDHYNEDNGAKAR